MKIERLDHTPGNPPTPEQTAAIAEIAEKLWQSPGDRFRVTDFPPPAIEPALLVERLRYYIAAGKAISVRVDGDSLILWMDLPNTTYVPAAFTHHIVIPGVGEVTIPEPEEG